MLEPTALYGGNADFLDALYEQYLRDPASVEPQWRNYFASLGPRCGPSAPTRPVKAAIAERAAQSARPRARPERARMRARRPSRA